jgi:hypothetical protein
MDQAYKISPVFILDLTGNKDKKYFEAIFVSGKVFILHIIKLINEK